MMIATVNAKDTCPKLEYIASINRMVNICTIGFFPVKTENEIVMKPFFKTTKSDEKRELHKEKACIKKQANNKQKQKQTPFPETCEQYDHLSFAI